MQDQPFFTVGIPTYNRAAMLSQCLRAVLNQTCGDFEVIVADNHSTDDTPQVMASITDPRVRYHRHDANLGPIKNFRFLVDQARGRFFVLNQDDDLLHRQFLERCRSSVEGQPGIAMYASAWWRGTAATGLSAVLAAGPEEQDVSYVLDDRPRRIEGKRAAARLLHTLAFIHPAIAMATPIIRDAGSYWLDVSEAVADLVLEARVLCRGDLVYDPRIGAVYREHTDNYSKRMAREDRRNCRRDFYAGVIAECQSQKFDWAASVKADLAQMTDPQLIWVFKEWIRYTAPPELQNLAWNVLKQRYGSGPGLWRKAISRIGLGKLLRFARQRSANVGSPHASAASSRRTDGSADA